MHLTLLGTSSLDYPSPRGRWLPLAQELTKQGHRVRLCLLHHTFDTLPTAERQQEIAGVQVEYVAQMHVYGPIGQRRYYGAAELLRVSGNAMRRLLQAALSGPCDAVHVCKPQPINGMAGLIAARQRKVPLFVDCDDYEAGGNRFGAFWQQSLVQIWEDQLPPAATGITVNTPFLRDRYLGLGLPAERLCYVPNGIADSRLVAPPARHVAGLKAALGLADQPVVVYAGTMSQTTHNVGLLLEAFALLRQRLPSARLLLVGDGEDRQALQAQAASLDLSSATVWTGSVDAPTVATYLALGDCSVDPVADDAVAQGRSPLKIIESLAVGTPVVTGNVGDRSALLADGRAGMLVVPGQATALATGLHAMLSDPNLRNHCAEAALQHAANYRWSLLAQQWASVYALPPL